MPLLKACSAFYVPNTGRHFRVTTRTRASTDNSRELGNELAVSVTIVTARVGGTPLYGLYRYVPSQRVWFLSHFGLKKGIDFDHYGLKSGMVFKGTTGAYKRICLFNSK